MKRISLFITSLLFHFALAAQQGRDVMHLNFDLFSIKDGLSQGMVQGIFQDKEGFMWFSSKDGLNKYDGYHVTVFRNNPKDPYSLPDNYVTQVLEDEKGNFWIGTAFKGLILFDKKSERFYSAGENIPHGKNESIRSIRYQNGKLYIVSFNDAMVLDVSKMKYGDFSLQNLSKIRLVINYNSIQKNEERKMSAIATSIFPVWLSDGSLWVKFPDSLFIYNFNKEISAWNITCLPGNFLGASEKENFILVELNGENKVIGLSENLLILYDISRNKIEYTTSHDKANYGTWSYFKDINNRIFFHTSNGNYCFDPKTYETTQFTSNVEPLMSMCNGHSSFTDRNGLLWIGTNGYGVLRYDFRKDLFRNVPLNSCSFMELNKEVLFSYTDNLISVVNPVNGSVIRHIPFPANHAIAETILLDKKGTIWSKYVAPTQLRYLVSLNTSDKTISKTRIEANQTKELVRVFIDNSDSLWWLKHGKDNSRSIVRLDKATKKTGEEYRFPNISDMTDYFFISDFWQDSYHIFWFGTIQGLFSFDPNGKQGKGEWHQWKNNPADTTSLSGEIIFSICPDAKESGKYLWIGTNGNGLNRFEFKTGKCIHFTENDGLPNNVVYGLLNDDSGNLWISTNKGLSCFNHSTKKFRNFTEEDGLPGNEFNRYEKLKLSSGDLLFGGVNGFTIFNPAEVLKKNPAPNIKITGFSVYNRPVDFKADSNIIAKPIGYAETIELSHDNNMFTFEFSVLEVSPQESKQYAYYMEGFDKNWIPNGSRNTATYTNLEPGKYLFHVKGCNSDGVWSEKDASIKVNILPAWYQTWWLKISIVFAFGGGLYTLYRYRLRQQTKLLNIRNNIASDLHDEIGSTLSSISLSSTIIQKKMNGTSGEVTALLNQISTNTDNMMEAMSDIVWTINTKNDRFDNVINRMRAFAIEILEPMDCQVHFDIGKYISGLALDMGQRKNLYLLFKESINNIAKYADCENVWITLSNRGGKQIVLTVRDDGKGFITNGREISSFGGNGIPGMHKRAQDLNGKVSINTIVGKGTEVVLEFIV